MLVLREHGACAAGYVSLPSSPLPRVHRAKRAGDEIRGLTRCRDVAVGRVVVETHCVDVASGDFWGEGRVCVMMSGPVGGLFEGVSEG
jgi:hypothetical protein